METLRKLLRCKIHRATVTHADLHYEGSITLAPELMEAAGLAEFEAVNIWNVTNGNRFETYTICGEPESEDICINGAAARLVSPGDLVIIAAYHMVPESKLAGYEPTVVFVDAHNRVKACEKEIPGSKDKRGDAKGAGENAQSVKVISENRKARHNYHILEEFEAGMVLTGPEIKSIRANGISLTESYVRPMKDEIFLIGAHIEPYRFDPNKDYVPTRTRKLLLNRTEIDKLRGKVEQKGMTIVPLKLYLKHGKAKLLIALAKGKDSPDKRQSMKEREGKRDAERAMKKWK